MISPTKFHGQIVKLILAKSNKCQTAGGHNLHLILEPTIVLFWGARHFTAKELSQIGQYQAEECSLHQQNYIKAVTFYYYVG